mmetsp:Transcript_5275/g.15986  ORF Transcript_5275/g.15986 Transcript_5275/m.15986 type:complete len:214 (-) Transcript_5275:50-691(-)
MSSRKPPVIRYTLMPRDWRAVMNDLTPSTTRVSGGYVLMNFLTCSGVQLMMLRRSSRDSDRSIVPSMALVVRASHSAPTPMNSASRSSPSFVVMVQSTSKHTASARWKVSRMSLVGVVLASVMFLFGAGTAFKGPAVKARRALFVIEPCIMRCAGDTKPARRVLPPRLAIAATCKPAGERADGARRNAGKRPAPAVFELKTRFMVDLMMGRWR